MNASEGEWTLEVLSPEGDVSQSVDVGTQEFEIGRNSKELGFPDDPDMAATHARIRFTSDGVKIADSGEGSGIWLRIQDAEGRRLKPNDQIWVGMQVLVVVFEDGKWFLRHHGPDGRRVQLHELSAPGAFIGRGSDIVLDGSDRALSRRHAQVVVDADAGLVLYDRGAHNGTYLRLVEPEAVASGTEIRIAAQRIRFVQRAELSGVESVESVESHSRLDPRDDETDKLDRPTARGLASRLRALGAARAHVLRSEGAESTPSGSTPSDAEPFEHSAAPSNSSAEIARVVIDVDGSSVTLESPLGKTVLEAVQEAGLERGSTIDWECEDGRCGICVVGIVEGADQLDQPDRSSVEMKTIQITEQVMPDPHRYRLACLARIRGDVRLRRLV